VHGQRDLDPIPGRARGVCTGATRLSVKLLYVTAAGTSWLGRHGSFS
jgi:hypothetical protein